jgi:hypothetical protein
MCDLCWSTYDGYVAAPRRKAAGEPDNDPVQPATILHCPSCGEILGENDQCENCRLYLRELGRTHYEGEGDADDQAHRRSD